MNSKIAKWHRWLEEINPQMRSLLWSRQIYNETLFVIRSNPLLPQRNSFLSAMQLWYEASALSGIRRQLKSSTQSISLVRLVEEIRDQSELLSRARWRTLHATAAFPEYADAVFSKYAGNAECIGRAQVDADLAALSRIALKCETFADKRLAHHDRGAEPELPTYENLDATLDNLNGLFKKYHVLVTTKSVSTETSIAYNWKSIFQQPWLPIAP